MTNKVQHVKQTPCDLYTATLFSFVRNKKIDNERYNSKPRASFELKPNKMLFDWLMI